MNFDVFSQILQKTHSQPTPLLRLYIKGLGHIPSFKTKKRGGIGRRRNGSTYPKVWTPPEVKEWMERCTQLLERQLRSYIATTGLGTTMVGFPRSVIASLVPLDDSRQWIKWTFVDAGDVPPGEEGAEIIIYKLT